MKKGFTLIELLIVIAILAILTTTVVLVLNPASMLAKARDSQRLADMDSLRSAISLYLATASAPTITALGPWSQGPSANKNCWSLHIVTCAEKDNYAVDGTGWVGIKLSDTPGGSPLAILPRDPSNTLAYHYAYGAESTNKTFELNAVLESPDNAPKMQNDGGDSLTVYEIGTYPGLTL
jgi:prepilin-type N-terminal cleavage/methylation domain-containing protein